MRYSHLGIHTAAELILKGVDVDQGYQSITDQVAYDHDMGFLILSERQDMVAKTAGQTAVLAFFNSGWQRGRVEVAESFTNKTDLIQIKPRLRTLDRQGRGTGARGYNTWQAAAGAAEDMEEIGLYAFVIDLNNLSDMRRSDSRQKLRSLTLRGVSKVLGEQAAIVINNQRLESYDAVVYNQTPDGKKQKARKGIGDSAVPERLMVVRRPAAEFTRAGIHRY